MKESTKKLLLKDFVSVSTVKIDTMEGFLKCLEEIGASFNKSLFSKEGHFIIPIFESETSTEKKKPLITDSLFSYSSELTEAERDNAPLSIFKDQEKYLWQEDFKSPLIENKLKKIKGENTEEFLTSYQGIQNNKIVEIITSTYCFNPSVNIGLMEELRFSFFWFFEQFFSYKRRQIEFLYGRHHVDSIDKRNERYTLECFNKMNNTLNFFIPDELIVKQIPEIFHKYFFYYDSFSDVYNSDMFKICTSKEIENYDKEIIVTEILIKFTDVLIKPKIKLETLFNNEALTVKKTFLRKYDNNTVHSSCVDLFFEKAKEIIIQRPFYKETIDSIIDSSKELSINLNKRDINSVMNSGVLYSLSRYVSRLLGTCIETTNIYKKDLLDPKNNVSLYKKDIGIKTKIFFFGFNTALFSEHLSSLVNDSYLSIVKHFESNREYKYGINLDLLDKHGIKYKFVENKLIVSQPILWHINHVPRPFFSHKMVTIENEASVKFIYYSFLLEEIFSKSSSLYKSLTEIFPIEKLDKISSFNSKSFSSYEDSFISNNDYSPTSLFISLYRDFLVRNNFLNVYKEEALEKVFDSFDKSLPGLKEIFSEEEIVRLRTVLFLWYFSLREMIFSFKNTVLSGKSTNKETVKELLFYESRYAKRYITNSFRRCFNYKEISHEGEEVHSLLLSLYPPYFSIEPKNGCAIISERIKDSRIPYRFFNKWINDAEERLVTDIKKTIVNSMLSFSSIIRNSYNEEKNTFSSFPHMLEEIKDESINKKVKVLLDALVLKLQEIYFIDCLIAFIEMDFYKKEKENFERGKLCFFESGPFFNKIMVILGVFFTKKSFYDNHEEIYKMSINHTSVVLLNKYQSNLQVESLRDLWRKRILTKIKNNYRKEMTNKEFYTLLVESLFSELSGF